MVKFRLYFDKDKETKWLNKMAAAGWAMTGFFAGFYKFEQSEKGKYSYQIDFGNKFFSVSKDYREFMEDADIEIVAIWGFWVFLRKLKSQGEFKLYTDVDSQIEHYQKILIMFKVATVIELICLFVEMFCVSRTENIMLWGAVFFILAMLLAFVKITLHTSDHIRELKERKTGIKEPRNRNVSGFLVAGLMFNSCALIIQDSVADYVQMSIQIVAIIFMLVGVYLTAKRQRES